VYFIEGKAPDAFETRSIPATFVVARNGTIAMRHIGAARWDSEEMVAFLRKLSAGGDPSEALTKKTLYDWERRFPPIDKPEAALVEGEGVRGNVDPFEHR
jgi:hypothetical protein